MTEANAWAQRWFAALPAEQTRSRKSPIVQNLAISAGSARARIHDGRNARPCQTSLSFMVRSLAEWHSALYEGGLPPYVLGLLLAQSYPANLMDALGQASLKLVPDPVSVSVACTCLSDGWCKHGRALWTRIGQEIERRPETLLRLQGLDQDTLMQVFEKDLEAFPVPPEDVHQVPLRLDRDHFWGKPGQLPLAPKDFPGDCADHVIRTMGIPPLWPQDRDLATYLTRIYETVRPIALDHEQEWGKHAQPTLPLTQDDRKITVASTPKP